MSLTALTLPCHNPILPLQLTHNAGKVAIGEIKQTEGKAAAEFGALGAGGAAMGGGGHTVQGAPHAKGRY